MLGERLAPVLQNLDAPVNDQGVVSVPEQAAVKLGHRGINSPEFLLLPRLVFPTNGVDSLEDFGILSHVNPPLTPVKHRQLLDQNFFLSPYRLVGFAQGTDQAAVFRRGFATP